MHILLEEVPLLVFYFLTPFLSNYKLQLILSIFWTTSTFCQLPLTFSLTSFIHYARLALPSLHCCCFAAHLLTHFVCSLRSLIAHSLRSFAQCSLHSLTSFVRYARSSLASLTHFICSLRSLIAHSLHSFAQCTLRSLTLTC